MTSEKEEALTAEAVRATILKGTLEYLIKEMTPERLTTFADDILKKSFTDIFGSWRLGGQFDESVKPLFLKAVNDPVFQARIQKAIQEGLNKAVAQLPDKVAKEITDFAVAGLRQKLAPEKRY